MHALIEALRRVILDGGDDRAPTAAICHAVVGGESAEGCIEQLVGAYGAALTSTARANVALAITVDLLRRGDVARWIAVRGPDHELDAALLEADKTIDVSDAMFVLASNAHAIATVGVWCRRDLERRMEELAVHLTDEGLLNFVGQLDIREPYAPFAPRLASILSRTVDPSLRSRAALQLSFAANLGHDIGVARDALRSALDDDGYFGNPAESAAQALTVMGDVGLDRDPRVAVRMGAARARPSFLLLLDPDPTIRGRVARDLLERIAKDAAVCPLPDELQRLLVEPLDPIVAEVMYAVIDRDEVAGMIARLEPRGMTRHLVAAAQAVLAHAPPPLCRTCREIPRHVSATDDEPRGLIGDACGECSAAYISDSYDMDDIYGSPRRTYDRQPARAPAEVARWRDRLDHPELWARRDAAWIVARDAVEMRDRPTLDLLATHPDVDVRREAWRLMPADRLLRALDDTDEEIRSYAAGQLAGSQDPAVIADLLSRDAEVAYATTVRMRWNEEYPENVVEALHARVLAARGHTRPDRALECVCRVLGGSLGKRLDHRVVDEALAVALQAPPAIQACLLRVFAGCAATFDTGALDDRIVELLRAPDTCEAAAELLRDRARAQRAIRVDHLQALPTLPSRGGQIAATILEYAARAEATRSVALAGLLTMIAQHQDTMVAPIIHSLAMEVSLGDAAPHVLDLAENVTSSYVRQELVRALIVDAGRRGDSACVASLVDHANPAIAQVARYTVR